MNHEHNELSSSLSFPHPFTYIESEILIPKAYTRMYLVFLILMRGLYSSIIVREKVFNNIVLFSM
jgi:hypothetical protein